MAEIVVPKWGLTMEEAVFVCWLVQVGDRVSVDQPVAELETDKADAELESTVGGRITELLATPGDAVVPGQVIALVADE